MSKARQRLGKKPFVWLFEEIARPVGDAALPGCFWRQFRVMAVDGTSLEMQDTAENRERFGIHRNQHGDLGYPQMKAAVLMECGTRVPVGCAVGRNNAHEPLLFDQLLSKLNKEMLLLADRCYFDYQRWKRCADYAGALLWRVKGSQKVEMIKTFEDGSYLARLRPSPRRVAKGQWSKEESVLVRVVEYRPQFEDGTEGETVRLFTNLLEPAEAPAGELARLFPERWSEETGFNEFKTYLRGHYRVLRSPLPRAARG